MSVGARNKAGLVSNKRSPSIVVDETAPVAGTVSCPKYVQVKLH